MVQKRSILVKRVPSTRFENSIYHATSTRHVDARISYGTRMALVLLAPENEKNVKQKKRYNVVLFYMEGYERKQISEILHIPY